MDCENIHQNDMDSCVRSVEGILNYKFRNPKLLEDALTHPSFSKSASYERLEFVGDAALGLAIANFLYITYPALDPHGLTVLRAANVCTEKLARIAVRHRFYRFVRHNSVPLTDKVHEFVLAVMEEDNTVVYGGAIKAPKVLADIVESIAAAVYIDCGFDLKALWMVLRGFLEPIVTLETLQEQQQQLLQKPKKEQQPVTILYELCRKEGKQVDIKHWRKDSGNFCSIYVDSKLIASATSIQEEVAKLKAAGEAMRALAQTNMTDGGMSNFIFGVDEKDEIIAAKVKLFHICVKKKWPKPNYRMDKKEGPSHARSYLCSVGVEVEEAMLWMQGEERPRVRDAENSAASFMICSLLAYGHFQNCVDL